MASSLIGIIKNVLSIYRCQDTSRKNYKSTNMQCRRTPNIALTHPNQSNSVPKHKGPSRGIPARSLMTRKNNECNKFIGSILYYARAVDMTVLMALSTIGMSQAKPTKTTMERCIQLMDYLATHSDAKIRFSASDHVAERAAIFSWEPSQPTANPSN